MEEVKAVLCIPIKTKIHKVVVKIDYSDRCIFDRYSWSFAGSNQFRLRAGDKDSKSIYLHRYLLGYTGPLHVDHINGDWSDNRKSNLRLATRSQNLHNMKPHADSLSGIKGVRQDHRGKWTIRIMVNRKIFHKGGFLTKEAATEAYNELAIDKHGQFARLNVIR